MFTFLHPSTLVLITYDHINIDLGVVILNLAGSAGESARDQDGNRLSSGRIRLFIWRFFVTRQNVLNGL